MIGLLTALGLAALALAAWLLLRRQAEKAKEPDPQECSNSWEQDEDERRREIFERELAEKKRLVKQIQQTDADLSKQLFSLAGLDSGTLQSAPGADLAEKLARRLSMDQLNVLNIAATQRDVEFDLESKKVREPVKYPTADMDFDHLRDFADLPEVFPEVLAGDDALFEMHLVEGTLPRMQSYDQHTDEKQLYVICDVSGSMDNQMPSGCIQKHIWSRGVLVSLLMDAIRGNSQYNLRFFDTKSFPLQQARTSQEAQSLIKYVLDNGRSGGGTSIFTALAQAVTDIRSGGEFSSNEILLVSDGEDGSVANPEQISGMLGPDIKLHTVMIGNRSPSLQSASQTYREFL